MTFTNLEEALDVGRWLSKSTGKVVYLFKYTKYHYEVEVFSWYFDIPYIQIYPEGKEEVTHLYREGDKDERQ